MLRRTRRELPAFAIAPATGCRENPLAATFDAHDAPSYRVTQYFEMFGNRALYYDGWVAGCQHGRLPWITAGSPNFDDDSWELYNIPTRSKC